MTTALLIAAAIVAVVAGLAIFIGRAALKEGRPSEEGRSGRKQ